MRINKIVLLFIFLASSSLSLAQNYNPVSYYFNGTPTHGIKIRTNIPFQNGLGMPTVMLEGYEYGGGNIIDIKISWYVYNGVFHQANASSSGSYSPTIKLANESGLVVLFIDDRKYYNRFNVRAYAEGKGETASMFNGWTVVDQALSGSNIKEVIYKGDLTGLTSGNVGIGTNSPQTKLHVTTGTSGDAILRLEADTDNNNEADNPGIHFVQDGGLVDYFVEIEGNSNTKSAGTIANALIMGTEANRDIQLISGDQVQVTVKSSGVGIGTTTPDAKLAVNGNIHAKEVKVDLTGWPDYVFKKDYDLPTLEEVEKHIQEKGHLINIPSAHEVEENGIQLGEMNKLLLEKIEELTLYVIQLKKENVEMEHINRELEDQKKEIERLKLLINNVRK